MSDRDRHPPPCGMDRNRNARGGQTPGAHSKSLNFFCNARAAGLVPTPSRDFRGTQLEATDLGGEGYSSLHQTLDRSRDLTTKSETGNPVTARPRISDIDTLRNTPARNWRERQQKARVIAQAYKRRKPLPYWQDSPL